MRKTRKDNDRLETWRSTTENIEDREARGNYELSVSVEEPVSSPSTSAFAVLHSKNTSLILSEKRLPTRKWDSGILMTGGGGGLGGLGCFGGGWLSIFPFFCLVFFGVTAESAGLFREGPEAAVEREWVGEEDLVGELGDGERWSSWADDKVDEARSFDGAFDLGPEGVRKV